MRFKESETFAEAKVRNELAERGKRAEKKVVEVLNSLKESHLSFDYDRHLDSRAAGMIITARVCDYTLFINGKPISLEVKSMRKGLRIAKFVQLPRMLRREAAGCTGYVLVYMLEVDSWVCLPISAYPKYQDSYAASWDISASPKYPSVKEAMNANIQGLKELK